MVIALCTVALEGVSYSAMSTFPLLFCIINLMKECKHTTHSYCGEYNLKKDAAR